MNADVLILGAGISGLTAARMLAERGLRPILLEARGRVGGRIFTRRAGDQVIELGAEFVHGRPPELWDLIREAGLEATERDGSQITFEDGELQDASGEQDDTFSALDELEDWKGADCTFAEYLERARVPPDKRWPLIGYVEGFNAADHRVISAAALGVQQKAEDSIEGDLAFHLRDGYDGLPAYLAAKTEELGGLILLNHPAKEVRWRDGHVEIESTEGTFSAPRAVITLPVGVLQARSVAFNPPVPAIDEPAAQLRMGDACRFTLQFRTRFWQSLPPQPAMRSLSFLFTFSEDPRVWWTPHPDPRPVLTGWTGGPRADGLLALSADELGRLACDMLARVFSLPVEDIHEQLVACHTHNWTADPYSRGAYSYVAASGLSAPATLAQPIAGTLFFAGEHTDTTGHWGTVHAAIRSGQRAAEQVIALSAPSAR